MTPVGAGRRPQRHAPVHQAGRRVQAPARENSAEPADEGWHHHGTLQVCAAPLPCCAGARAGRSSSRATVCLGARIADHGDLIMIWCARAPSQRPGGCAAQRVGAGAGAAQDGAGCPLAGEGAVCAEGGGSGLAIRRTADRGERGGRRSVACAFVWPVCAARARALSPDTRGLPPRRMSARSSQTRRLIWCTPLPRPPALPLL